MIVEEILQDHLNLIRRYSDAGFLIRQDQTGIEYGEAVDLISSPYTYTETDTPINPPEPEPEPEPEPDPDDPTPEPEPEPEDPDDELLSIYEAYDILLGDD